MRVIIKSQQKYLEITDWFVKQEGITRKTAEILHETEKAVLLDFGSGREKWIPRSLFTTHKIPVGLEAWQ